MLTTPVVTFMYLRSRVLSALRRLRFIRVLKVLAGLVLLLGVWSTSGSAMTGSTMGGFPLSARASVLVQLLVTCKGGLFHCGFHVVSACRVQIPSGWTITRVVNISSAAYFRSTGQTVSSARNAGEVGNIMSI